MTEHYLMIEHTGRRTGRTRRTIVECFQQTPEDGAIVASALGTKGAWFSMFATPDRLATLADYPDKVTVVEFRPHPS